MNKFRFLFLVCAVMTTNLLSAQVGLRVGVNMINQIKTVSGTEVSKAFETNNLSAYKIGLVLQSNAYKNGLGMETGIFYCQKGATVTPVNPEEIQEGVEMFKKSDNVEFPLNIRFRQGNKYLGFSATAGLYASYALYGQMFYINESDQSYTSNEIAYKDMAEQLEYGYALGLGVDVYEKIQLGINWSHGLQKKQNASPKEIVTIVKSDAPRQFTVHATYVF